jgi:[NiFe] hydrogenase assembly HybE family chaperone
VSEPGLSTPQRDWVQRLASVYEDVARTRMAGLPVVHPKLVVEVLGFRPWVDATAGVLGVLVTPWCLNLVWRADDASCWAVGVSSALQIGAETLPFVGHHDPQLGAYACCSLVSPMFQFADQAAAHATAVAAMAALTAPAPAPPMASTPPVQADRRRFLLGGRARPEAA